MKLLLRREQRSGMLGGKPVFSLDVRADLTAAEREHVKKYKLADTILYQRYKTAPPLEGATGFIAGVLMEMDNITIAVRDLENGRRIECKDVLQMIGVEALVKEAAANFKAVLEAAATFGGEEVVEL